MVLILLLGLGLLCAAVTLLLRAVSLPRARSAERMEIIEAYGYAGQAPAIAPERSGRGVGELVTAVGGRIAERFGRVREADLRQELMSAGFYEVSPRTLLGYRAFAMVLLPVLAVLSGAAGGSVTLNVILVIVTAVSGWMAPLIYVRRNARFRLTTVDRALPDLIDILVVTIEAGMGFSGSMRVAAREMSGPLQDELLLSLQEQSMGLSSSDALENMLQRCDTPSMRSFVRSVVQGEALGVSTGVIMRNLAVEMRKRRRAAAEERAQQAPIKMLFPLVFLIFPVIFIVLLGPAIFKISDAFS